MIVIVGAGLAGLSVAYHLRGMPRFWAGARGRRTCRSYVKDGFTFDYTGHSPFSPDRDQGVGRSLLPDRLQQHARNRLSLSRHLPRNIRSRSTRTAFLLKWCRVSAGIHRHAVVRHRRCRAESPSFKQWIIESPAKGSPNILWCPGAKSLAGAARWLTSDWNRVPVAQLKRMSRTSSAALTIVRDKAFGYNPSFQYPVSGGIRRCCRFTASVE